jgi:putative N6-adenine-specific DNA methylase
MTRTDRLYATAMRGTADVVARELTTLGFAGVRWDAGGCVFSPGTESPFRAGMRAVLHLRSALRVLWPLATFAAPDADALYQGARAIAWEDVLAVDRTFAIHATTSAPPPLAHAPFLGQRVKDAIVDRLRELRGGRPSVDRDRPDVLCYVRVAEDGQTSVGLDVGGGSLHQRGYRVDGGVAPLRETLAAALVLLTGWKADRPLVDPLCGSGTLLHEAALFALAIAPGLLRPAAGFERWPLFGDAENETWRALREEARARIRPDLGVPLVGRDRDPDAIAAARANTARLPAAVGRALRFEVADVRELAPFDPVATLISNPPYGERLAGDAAPVFLRSLGQRLRGLDGHTAFLLLPPAGHAALGMRASWERRLMNGPLAVTFARYELGRTGSGLKSRRPGR